MALRGLSNTADLARAWGLPVERVARLVERPEEMLAVELVAVRTRMGVRGGWLMTGHGSMLPVTATPGAQEAVRTFDGLPPEKARYWLRIGKRMTLG